MDKKKSVQSILAALLVTGYGFSSVAPVLANEEVNDDGGSVQSPSGEFDYPFTPNPAEWEEVTPDTDLVIKAQKERKGVISKIDGPLRKALNYEASTTYGKVLGMFAYSKDKVKKDEVDPPIYISKLPETYDSESPIVLIEYSGFEYRYDDPSGDPFVSSTSASIDVLNTIDESIYDPACIDEVVYVVVTQPQQFGQLKLDVNPSVINTYQGPVPVKVTLTYTPPENFPDGSTLKGKEVVRPLSGRLFTDVSDDEKHTPTILTYDPATNKYSTSWTEIVPEKQSYRLQTLESVVIRDADTKSWEKTIYAFNEIVDVNNYIEDIPGNPPVDPTPDTPSTPDKPSRPSSKPSKPSQPAKPAQPTTTQKESYRLYNPATGEHFFTTNKAEHDLLAASGNWKSETSTWKAPEKSDFPIYRLCNPHTNDHHYTMNAGERDALVKLGWRDEGIGLYSADSDGVEVYRLYNPNATVGSHHYTTSALERDYLVSLGWNAEGVGFYGLK